MKYRQTRQARDLLFRVPVGLLLKLGGRYCPMASSQIWRAWLSAASLAGK